MTTMLKPRHQKFLEALPRNGFKVEPSALEAGYSKSYARKRGKLLYQTAIKEQAKDIVTMTQNGTIPTKEVKRLMSDIVGMTPDSIMARLKAIAMQDKDLNSALKVLAVLAREHGIEMDSDAPKVTIPVLNVSLKPSVEPRIDSPANLPTTSIVGNIDEAVE